MCRSKHVEPLKNFGIINYITRLHLAGIYTQNLWEMWGRGDQRHMNTIMCQLMITIHDDIFAGVSLNDVGVPGCKLSAVIARRRLHGGVGETGGLVEREGNFRLLRLLHALIHLLSH